MIELLEQKLKTYQNIHFGLISERTNILDNFLEFQIRLFEHKIIKVKNQLDILKQDEQ
jgi:hypothetical protein